jgi:predicted DNA-binding protein (UPF0251 family)
VVISSREAVLLTELQEMSQKDAARMLGVSLSAVKSRVRRGRRQIQETLRACSDTFQRETLRSSNNEWAVAPARGLDTNLR